MNYLFFDLECAKCEKGGIGYICEFGYVLVDEGFDIIEKNHFMINPDHEFDQHALKNVLRYTEEEYKANPLFPEFYPRIKDILTKPDQMVIGHTTASDNTYIASQCKRYNLPKITFRFYDLRVPFQGIMNEKSVTGLDKMLIKLGLEKPDNMHNALTDAIATMTVTKELCAKYEKTVTELFTITPPRKKKKERPSKKESSYSIGEWRSEKGIEYNDNEESGKDVVSLTKN